MKLSKERIGVLARGLIKGLADRQHVSWEGSEAKLVEAIEKIITEELMLEDRLESDAKELLRSYASEIQKGNADFDKMFLMIKKKLAKERGIIL